MRNGSIRVAVNDVVQRGDTLGLVGSSGNSNWPHLHFEVLWQNAQHVDPFLGGCNLPLNQPTWLNQLPWQGDFAVLDVGLTNQPQSFPELLERPDEVEVFKPGDEWVVFWANLLNIQAGGTSTVLYDPDGVIQAIAATGPFTSFSTRFLVANFPTGPLLQRAGEYAVALRVSPLAGGDLIEVARRTFVYDPAGVPAPPRAARPVTPVVPHVWLGPDGGEPGASPPPG